MSAAARSLRAWRMALCLVFLLGAPRPLLAATDELALAPWQRAGVVPLPDDECQELRIGQVGQGLLELRFFTEPVLPATGPDPKTTGASLILAAADVERASFLLYQAGSIYERSARLPPPIRWTRNGNELCIASGSHYVFCGRTAGEVRRTTRIAFGDGWETELTGCAPFSVRERPIGAGVAAVVAFVALAVLALRTSRRVRDVIALVLLAGALACAAVGVLAPGRLPSPALLPSGAIASGLVATWALLERRRSWAGRAPRIALGLFVVFALARIPHPVWTEMTVDPVVPQLWLDGANWQPQGAHQSLQFRERPLASVEAGAENWLVVGGSVVFGDGVDAYQAFPAVAQDLLRSSGDRKVVLNAGVQGWNIQNIDRLLADLGDALPVTGIALVSILNNATLPIAAPDRFGCERSLVRGGLCNVLRNQLLVTWPKVFLPKPKNPERYRRTLRRLLERELALGRRVVLLDEASEIDGGPLRLWNADTYRAIAREIGAELGVPFHPVADALASLPPERRFFDGIHPTAAAHALIGRRLYEILREQ